MKLKKIVTSVIISVMAITAIPVLSVSAETPAGGRAYGYGYVSGVKVMAGNTITVNGTNVATYDAKESDYFGNKIEALTFLSAAAGTYTGENLEGASGTNRNKSGAKISSGEAEMIFPTDATYTFTAGTPDSYYCSGGAGIAYLGLKENAPGALMLSGGAVVANAFVEDVIGGSSYRKAVKGGIVAFTGKDSNHFNSQWPTPDSNTTAATVYLNNSSTIADGKTTANADTYAYGIYTHGGKIVFLKPSSGVTPQLKMMGSTAATDATEIVVPDGYKIIGEASTTYDAATKVAYNADDLANYKWIDVKVVSEDYVEPSEPEDTNVEMTVAGTSEVVEGKKNVGFTATVAADTYNSVLMKYDGAVYGWRLDTAITLADQAEVGIQVNNVPEAATIVVKLSTAIIE